MKIFVILCNLLLFLAAPVKGVASTHIFRFIDELERPIPGVAIRYSYTSVPPAPPGGSGSVESDTEGKATLPHPCGVSSGSCCILVSPVTYTIVKQGFRFNYTGGSVSCGFASGNLELTVTGTDRTEIASVSGASYKALLTNESITAAFGANIASAIESATLPLTTSLGGRNILIRDSKGLEKAALLLFVSPGQINYIMPPGLSEGSAIVLVRDESNRVLGVGFNEIARLSPGVFTANADGKGPPAAVLTRVKPGNAQSSESVVQLDEMLGRFVPALIDLGPAIDVVILSLFGTGWRQLRSISNVSVKIGGIDCPVEYAGGQPTLEGLDQINVRLLRTLAGQGDVSLEVKIEGSAANIVQLKIK